jgi:hypothetical protein
MLASGWPVMRSSSVRIMMMLVLLAAASLRAAETIDETAVAAPRATLERPEYLPEPLPDDLFQPSKEINDDYAIPLPVDI